MSMDPWTTDCDSRPRCGGSGRCRVTSWRDARGWTDFSLALAPTRPPCGWRAHWLAQAHSRGGHRTRASALHFFTRARDACSKAGEQAALATTLKYLGVIALKGPPPDHTTAAELFEASLQLRRELDDRDGIASCLNDLGVLARDMGDFARARRYLDESLDLCRALGNRYGLSFVLNNLSLVALHEGAYQRVPQLLEESLALAQELGSREKIACALTGFASLAAVRSEPITAARLFGAADALRQAIGVPMSPAEQTAHDRHLALARAALAPNRWETCARRRTRSGPRQDPARCEPLHCGVRHGRLVWRGMRSLRFMRFGAAALVGLLFALTLSIGFARSNDYPVGRAFLTATGTSGVSGEAFVRRQLTAGTTEVQVRLTGLSTTSAPVWQIESGGGCGVASTTMLLKQTRAAPVTSLGTSMTAETQTATLNVTSTPAMMTVHIYDTTSGSPVDLACGQIYNQPTQTGSEHWW